MTKTTKTTATPELTELTEQAAIEQANTAQQKYEGLLDKLAAGEPVPPGQLLTARDEADYAILAVDGARRADQLRQDRDRRAALDKLAATAANALPDSEARVTAAARDAADAIGQLFTVLADHQGTYSRLWSQARRLGNGDPAAPIRASDGKTHITWADGSAKRVEATDVLKAAVFVALSEAGNRESPLKDRGWARSDLRDAHQRCGGIPTTRDPNPDPTPDKD